MSLEFAGLMPELETYALSIISKLLQGDVGAIAIVALFALLVIGLIAGVGSILFKYLKSIVLLVIIGASLYYMVSSGAVDFNNVSLTTESVMGVIGVVFGVIALFIAAKSTLASHKEIQRVKGEEEKVHKEKLEVEEEKVGLLGALKGVHKDKGLLGVISYAVIAEFGVFSSVTVAAPTAQVGIAFVGVFFLAAFAFLRNSYDDYWKGVRHLAVLGTLCFGLSILLGHYWALIPLTDLLSMAYFTSPAAVATVTGVAVALFMTS